MSTTNYSDTKFIQQCSKLIEAELEAHGFYVKVAEIEILPEHYQYNLDISVGTDLNELEKHDRDLALILSSPTGKVEFIIPIPGKSLIGVKVPKPTEEYFENIRNREEQKIKGNTLRHKLAFIFFLLSRFNIYIAKQILGDDL